VTEYRGPVTDTHQHFWDLSVRPQPWLDTAGELAPLRRTFSPDQLAPLASAAGVTSTVVVQTVIEPGETPELLAVAESGQLVRSVVGWVDLTAAGVADALAALRELPGARYLTAIRHPLLVEPDPDWLARPAVLRGLAAVAEAGLAFDIVGHPFQLPAAVRAAAVLPQLTFVLDHLGNVEVGPQVDEQWAAVFGQLGALQNTVCKLSGFLGERAADGSGSVRHLEPYFALALDHFGPQRLMFGSDWPVSTLGASYLQVVGAARALTAELSLAEQEAIFAGTASRIYRTPAEGLTASAR
jgi:L-fuconolactonase